MTECLHTVAITGDEDSPRIEFTCHGGRDAECHSYHDECWMKSFFDNADHGAIDPFPETFAECELTPGTSGPITAYFNGEYIEWEFVTEAPSA